MAILASAGVAVMQFKFVRAVEFCLGPIGGAVARSAIQAEQPGVVSGVGMAGAAIGGSPLKDDPIGAGDMATGAGKPGMCAGQRENAQGVVKSRGQPAGWRMANRTIRAERAFMIVIPGMAGIAIHRRAFKNVIGVAVGASHGLVFAN